MSADERLLIRGLRVDKADLEREILRVRTINAELLAALQYALESKALTHQDARDMARAAIAKAQP